MWEDIALAVVTLGSVLLMSQFGNILKLIIIKRNEKAQPGATVKLSAQGTSDPDGDKLSYHWWQYEVADTLDRM